jgi:hypothetical protein
MSCKMILQRPSPQPQNVTSSLFFALDTPFPALRSPSCFVLQPTLLLPSNVCRYATRAGARAQVPDMLQVHSDSEKGKGSQNYDGSADEAAGPANHVLYAIPTFAMCLGHQRSRNIRSQPGLRQKQCVPQRFRRTIYRTAKRPYLNSVRRKPATRERHLMPVDRPYHRRSIVAETRRVRPSPSALL